MPYRMEQIVEMIRRSSSRQERTAGELDRLKDDVKKLKGDVEKLKEGKDDGKAT